MSVLSFINIHEFFLFMFFHSACPTGYQCLPDIGTNPNDGYTNFDNIFWAMVTGFQLITLDYWENVYNLVCILVMCLLFCLPFVYLLYLVFFTLYPKRIRRPEFKGKHRMYSPYSHILSGSNSKIWYSEKSRDQSGYLNQLAFSFGYTLNFFT